MYDEQEWIDLLRGKLNPGNDKKDEKDEKDDKKDNKGDGGDGNTGALVPVHPKPEVTEILWLLCGNNQMYPVRDPDTVWQTWLTATPENRQKMDNWLAANPYHSAPPPTGAVYPYFN
jgi:hypothetical protein